MRYFKDENKEVWAYDDIQIAATVRAEHERKAIETANEAAFQKAIDDAREAAKIEADAKAIELSEASEQAVIDAGARHAEKATQIEQDLADAIEAASDTSLEDEAKAEALALVDKLKADKIKLDSDLADEIKAINDALPQSIEQASNQIEAEAVDAAIKNFTPLETTTFDEEAIQTEIDAAIAEAVGDKVPMTDAEFKAYVNPPLSLDQAKAEKLAEIKSAYNTAADAPVEAGGQVWDGGFESAIKLDAAMRLSQAAGANGVVFFDANNTAQQLGFDDALQVCIAVAVAYQTALAKKQSLYASIEAATSKTQVAAISW